MASEGIWGAVRLVLGEGRFPGRGLSVRNNRQPRRSRRMLPPSFPTGDCMTRTEKLLRELIALPSVNPAFLPAQNPRAGEQRVAEFLAATAARAGLDVEFQAVSPGRSNLLARLSPRGKVRQRILLAPHMDTVNAADEQFTPSKTEWTPVWPRRLRHQRLGGDHANGAVRIGAKPGSGRRKPRSSLPVWSMRSTARRVRAPWRRAG